ncbi:MAG: hypothetical protein M0R76_14360, partial [Proteobacteria bacterium]|nr:hypothetical protein [Pseudomonadota bacterium]
SLRMQRCYDCHRQQRANTACKTCHLTHPDGRMKHDADGVRRVPPTWLAGPTHGAAWERTHGASAGANASFCQNCHAQKYCTDCHAGRRAMKRHHPPGWMTAHALSARIDAAYCSQTGSRAFASTATVAWPSRMRAPAKNATPPPQRAAANSETSLFPCWSRGFGIQILRFF